MPYSSDLASDAEIVFAKRLYEQRRARSAYFPSLAFTEPAWDILLYLFIRQGKKVTSREACEGSATNKTTALRYVDRLIEIGMIERFGCNIDRRVQFVSLTEKALEQMREYMAMPDAFERVTPYE